MTAAPSDSFGHPELAARLQPVKLPAWKPIVQAAENDRPTSQLGGMPWLAPHETHPTCPNCDKPLQLILQLNLDQLPQKLAGQFGNGLLQFFYCTSTEPLCEVDCEAWSPFAITHFIRIVLLNPEAIANVHSTTPTRIEPSPAAEEPFPSRVIVDWEEVTDYPDWQELPFYGVDLSADDYYTFLQQHTLTNSDKLAGWSHWIQNIEYPHCPMCDAAMAQLVFEFESEDNLPYQWGDVGKGYLLQCPQHKDQIAFLWQCT